MIGENILEYKKGVFGIYSFTTSCGLYYEVVFHSYIKRVEDFCVLWNIDIHGAPDKEVEFFNVEFYAIEGGEKQYRVMNFTDKKTSFEVIRTVNEIIKEFLVEEKPDALFFTAKEKSRVTLYDRFAKSIQSFGYAFTSFDKKEKLYLFTKGYHG